MHHMIIGVEQLQYIVGRVSAGSSLTSTDRFSAGRTSGTVWQWPTSEHWRIRLNMNWMRF